MKTRRVQELSESRGGCPELPVRNSPYRLYGRKATFEEAPQNSVDVERATFEEESKDMHNPPIKLTCASLDRFIHKGLLTSSIQPATARFVVFSLHSTSTTLEWSN